MINKNLSDCGSELTLMISNKLTINEFNDFKKSFDHISLKRSLVKVDFSKTDYLDTSALGMLLILEDMTLAVKGSMSLILPAAESKAMLLLRVASFHNKFNVTIH